MDDDLRRAVLAESYDVIRLWELQAQFPDVPRDRLRAVVLDLIASELVELVPTNAEDPALAPSEVRDYVDDDMQWLNIFENPWPQRGTIHELIATEYGRAALHGAASA